MRHDHDVVVLAQPSVRERAEAIGATFQRFSELGDDCQPASFDDQLDLIGTAIVGRRADGPA